MTENYHMHLPQREIKDEQELQSILKAGKYAMIAMCRNNEPYVVTLSYGYDAKADVFYLHSPISGLKLDIIRDNSSVCATVIEDRGYQSGRCTHSYRSVVIFGNMSVITDETERVYGMQTMLNQLEPNPRELEEKLLRTKKFSEETAVMKIKITEKRGKEL
ncbi:MAG: pyridoxamine 5'-phosphate oxidase family protein [Bacillota bacterium]|nr:pyridoxamine 5'-phosphate oxidase family protein [Bacillota bacterium]MDW7684406.1 pyridoxamine 5'-phosphate oxidase family protein [Bacillota bacterium]